MAKTSSVEKNNRRKKRSHPLRRETQGVEGRRSWISPSRWEERFRAQLKLAKLPRNSAKIRIRNRCEITGRPRSVYRKLGMSRIALRQLGIPGRSPVSSSQAGKEDKRCL